MLDIGFGDGKVCLAAAKRGARAVGWEVDVGLIAIAEEQAGDEGLAGRCDFHYVDCCGPDALARLRALRPTVVYCFLLPSLIDRIDPVLRAAVADGARLVTVRFHPNWGAGSPATARVVGGPVVAPDCPKEGDPGGVPEVCVQWASA